MEHVIDLYHTPLPATEVLLCFDEKSKQLLDDSRPVVKEKIGSHRHRDYEYVRGGTKNIFVTVEPTGGHREVTVTARRTRTDFAEEVRRVVSLPRYAEKTMIHIVLDNLNTHNEQSLINTFGTKKTKQLMKRITFHHTPKHASWLNMAEIEIGILSQQCIKGRIGTEEKLKTQITAWTDRRNTQKRTINWKCTTEDMRRKFKYSGGTELS